PSGDSAGSARRAGGRSGSGSGSLPPQPVTAHAAPSSAAPNHMLRLTRPPPCWSLTPSGLRVGSPAPRGSRPMPSATCARPCVATVLSFLAALAPAGCASPPDRWRAGITREADEPVGAPRPAAEVEVYYKDGFGPFAETE